MTQTPGVTMSPINFQVLERSGEQWLGLGDPLHSEEDVARRTAYMADKRNADRMLRKNLASLAGFESSYSISRLGSFVRNIFCSVYKQPSPWSRPVGAHVAAMDRRDIYVSVVTSLNTWFGSKASFYYTHI